MADMLLHYTQYIFESPQPPMEISAFLESCIILTMK